MNKVILFLSAFLIFSWSALAQLEKYPVYKGCETDDTSLLEKCFLEKVTEAFYSNFKLPDGVPTAENHFYVIFIASKNGEFEVIFVSSTDTKMNKEVERVFGLLPEFEPATFNGHPVDKQFILYYPDKTIKDTSDENPVLNAGLENVDKTTKLKSSASTLRVPYSNSYYNHLESNSLKNNIHTTFKPFIYNQTIDSLQFENEFNALLKEKSSWWGRKLWNEHLVEVTGENFWFHIDPFLDIQLGKDNSDLEYTYNNTRAVKIEGSLYKKLSFSSSLYESQGRFADYFNRYAESIKPSGGNPAIVPGQGIAKEFGTNAFDYPVATGYLSYSPNKTFNFQLGRDKNFIGDGYRSMMLSDNASPHTFFKIQSNFWKIQYTNLWMWLRDVRPEVTVDGVYRRKFVAIHHLSWNATKRLNIGLFESVIWSKTANQGFDFDYINPIILFRPVEFSVGSKSGNAMLGMNAKYQFTNDISVYSQILFDEITLKEITGNNGYWGNKYGFQLGAKYHNAFKVDNLTLQTEYNMARPYTYSHNHIETNYGHFNQSLAHPWGANFKEILFIADYQKNRWFGRAKAVSGTKGFDYNSLSDSYSYGGDIFRDYSDRNADYGIETGQGNKAKMFIGELQVGYLINPTTNLKLFGSMLFRKFDTPVQNQVFENGNTTWFTFGLRSDLSNWYFDF